MSSSARSGASCLLVLLLGLAPGLGAQEEPPAPQTPPKEESTPAEVPPAEVPPAEVPAAEPVATPPPAAKQPHPFSLYVEAATGSVGLHELETSVQTLSTHLTETTLSWDDQISSRAAIGWKLPRGRGDFRLIFDGYKEEGYTLRSTGEAAALDPSGSSETGRFAGNLPWWTIDIDDGRLISVRTPPVWVGKIDVNENGTIDPGEENDDANLNDTVDPGEERFLAPDLMVDRAVADNLDNRAQTWDLVFGNEWGPRRFRGRWWAGFRYFAYEGNVLATAWLSTDVPGEGFTDGSFLRVLNIHQDTTGFGPTGSMEAQFKFFRERLSLYLQGQAAFMLLDLEADTGEFFTLVLTPPQGEIPPNSIPAPARLNPNLSKSTWHTGLEIGARWQLRNGLRFEAAYHVDGFLDSVILPTSIRIPETTDEARFGTTALYTTQDYTVDGWRAGIAFQF